MTIKQIFTITLVIVIVDVVTYGGVYNLIHKLFQ